MCRKIDPATVEKAVGYFDKRGDGNPQRFEILVTACECGSTYWARVPNGFVWVEAEREEARDVSTQEAEQFAKEIDGRAA